ncbi:MAG: metallophosphoesterase [Abditibacteriota bacterium]|nr:metallophosphoesterase [Abditibacteriota bacterium]
MKKLILCLALCLATVSLWAYGISFRPDIYYTQKEPLAVPAHTYEAWLRLPKDFRGRGGSIAGNYDMSSCSVVYEVHGEGHPRLYIEGKGHKQANITFKSINAATGKYLHMAITLDEEKHEAKCYINGRLAETLTEVPMYTETKPLSEFETVQPNIPLVIGGDKRFGNGAYFHGQLLSVAEFSTVRTEKEIRGDMYGLDPKDPGLLFYYDLRKAEGKDVIEDLAGNYPLYHEPNPYYIQPEDTWVEEKDVDNSPIAWSMAFLGDTQVLNDVYPDKFHLLMDGILAKKDLYNIKYVMGLGDITNRNLPREWELAKEQYDRLTGVIDWGVVIGNHDGSKEYNAAFGTPEYKASCDGFFEEGKIDNSYRFLTVGQNKYIIFTLEYGPRDEVMEWAGRLIDAHPECKAVITTHNYLFRDGTTMDEKDSYPPTICGGRPNNGDHMWDKFVRKHRTIQLVICGHDPFDMVVCRQEKGDAGNLVTALLIDPQSTDAVRKGVCLICFLGFSEDGKKAYVRYWSADQRKYFIKANQYEIDLE